MGIEIKQSSKRVAEHRWKWAVWLDGDPEELAGIEGVVYHLHPTFRNPVRTITAGPHFRLSTSGWGTFTLGIEIHHMDGKVETREHGLTFEEGREEAEEKESRAPRRVLLLNESEDSEPAAELSRMLEAEGVDVKFASDLGGGTWSKELIDGIREVDAVLSVGNAHRGSFRIEAKAAEKLGKQLLRLGTKEQDVKPERFHALSYEQLADAASPDTDTKFSRLLSENLKRTV